MDDDDLRTDLVRLYAADEGVRCPLVPAPGTTAPQDLAALRVRCRAAVQTRLVADAAGLRVWLARTAREVFLSEPALRRGLGVEDVAEFWGWFDRALWSAPAPAGHGRDQRPVAWAPTP